MKRPLTRREKTLLCILLAVLLLAAYVNLFLEPVKSRYSRAQEHLSEVEDMLLEEQARAAQLRNMEAELEKLKDTDAFQPSEVPVYDNIDAVMVQLDGILSPVTDYQLTFSDVNFGDILVTRPVNMTFTAENYNGAKDTLSRLYQCPYRCSLSDITIVSVGDSADQADITAQKVSVTLTVTFYEAYKDAAAKAAYGRETEAASGGE
ncbi:hypothetical protein AALB39_15085 [Lachnospiraceae bacterium 54-53]